MKLPFQLGDKIIYFEGPVLDREESNRYSYELSKRIGKELVGESVIVDRYTEATRSVAPGFPEP